MTDLMGLSREKPGTKPCGNELRAKYPLSSIFQKRTTFFEQTTWLEKIGFVPKRFGSAGKNYFQVPGQSSIQFRLEDSKGGLMSCV